MSTIYLDHAASSWPKPPEVVRAMVECMEEYGANPGRGSHEKAVKASRTLFEGRKQLARLFHIKNPNDIAYALNTTMALNLAIKGFVREGDHVICTAVEHNSVRRPLEYLKAAKGVQVSYVKTDAQGNLNPDDLVSLITSRTKLVVCSHSSNLLGSILPIADMAEICRKHQVKLLVDAAQTAGTIDIDVNRMGIDMLAFPGHKGLLGPQGTGAYIFIRTLIWIRSFMGVQGVSQKQSSSLPSGPIVMKLARRIQWESPDWSKVSSGFRRKRWRRFISTSGN